MRRIVFSLLSVVMLIFMTLPAVSPPPALATETTILFQDDFGSGTNIDNVEDWDLPGYDDWNVDSDNDEKDAAIRAVGGEGFRYLRLRDGAYVEKHDIDTTGLMNIHLEYTWGQDTDCDGSDDGDLVVEWKLSSSGTWTAVNTHDLVDDTETPPNANSLDLALDASAEGTSIDIRFRGDTDEDEDRARVDNVIVSGDPACTIYYRDNDDDDYGQTGDSQCLSAPSGNYTATEGGDCDDTDPTINPSAAEVCNDGRDNDCDGLTDCDDTGDCPTYYRDDDGDGYGQTGDSQCPGPSGNYTATEGGDCDDTDAAINPGATEVCNGYDDDCDGKIDEEGATGCTTYYKDVDDDTYGVTGDSKCLCAAADPYDATQGGDCDDNDAAINPGATEVCNDGVDNDCDGLTDLADPDCGAGQPPHLRVDKSVSPDPNCGQATVTLTVRGAGDPSEERLPVDVMLIIDRSGSMMGAKMTAAKQAAKDFIDLLDSSHDRVGLVSYSDGAILNSALTTDFAAVKSAIDGLSASGYTNIGDAINTANTEFVPPGNVGRPGAVWVEILLTDGWPNRPNGMTGDFSEDDAAYARDFAEDAADDGIMLYTIGLGNPPGISHYFLDDLPASSHTYQSNDPAGHPYYHDGLAYVGGGDYYHAPTPADLEFMFEEISEDISSIAGKDVVVTEVLPDGVNYADSAVPAEPDEISPDGQTLTWNLGVISINETWTVTFSVTFDEPGYQLVDEYPDTRVDYTNYLGDPEFKVFPRTYITVQDCDDGDPCTIDTCENETCVHTPIDCDYLDDWYKDGDPYTECDGNDVCTYQDWVYLDYECVEGECVPTPIDWDRELLGCQSCDDGDPCTIDTCENGTCVHTPIDCDYLDGWVADGSTYTACNETQVCTYQDMVYLDHECVGGNCVPTETDWRTDLISCQSCDDGDPCTIDTCENGTCVHTPMDCDYLDGWVADGSTYTACNETQVCTYQDMVYLDYECVGGNCVPTETDWRTDLISCQSCDDGDPCTIDTCENGTCVHTPIDCDYLDGWVADGSTYTACNETQVCTYQDMVYLDYECVGGNCVPTETDWRTDLISCQSCDDGDPCTIDTCENGTCVHTPMDCDYLDGWVADGSTYTACNETQVCTYQDMVYLDYECVGGNCVPTETDWRTDLIGCQSCDDGDPCTIDTCENGTCVHTPMDCDYLDGWVADGSTYTACNETQVCTYQDMVYLDYECVGGNCVPTETDWRTDLIGCQSCDDGDPCTIDTCENGTCVHTPMDCDYLDGWVADGSTYTACNETQVCTYQDMVYLDYECVGGNCVPTETDWRTDLIGCQSCDDGDPCTIDTCENGTCVHTPMDCDYLDGWVADGSTYTACNETQVCTYQDMVYLDYECVGGNCVPTETDWRTDLIGCQSCDDGDPCTIDTCENGTCVHTPIDCDYLDGWVADGSTYTACNETQVCTYQDMVYLDYECVGGNCVPTETDWRTDLIGCQSCDDGDPCTIDTCENGTCVHTPAAPTATASSNSPVSQGATIYLYGGPAGMASYSWTGPSNWTSSDQNATRPNATTAMTGIYTLVVTNEHGCSDDATTNVEVTVPATPAGGGGAGCPRTKHLTVDWEGNNTTKPLYSNDKLALDLLGPSPDTSDNLFLERGTHAPVVDERTYYLIVVRELEQIPALPDNTVAIVVLNITPTDAEFNRDILLTLGLNQTQLPANTLNVTMAYYDDVNGLWQTLEYEAGGPNGVAELTLSAPINHFSIYGVLAELTPEPTSPAHFVPSGLSIEPSVKKISAFVTKTGETVTITANVANDGGQEGTYTVALKLNGETVDTATVTIGAGQTKQVSFTRSGLDYGQYDVEVAGLSGEFTVSQTLTWWLIILIIIAIGLIIWGVVWGLRRRRKAQQET